MTGIEAAEELPRSLWRRILSPGRPRLFLGSNSLWVRHWDGSCQEVPFTAVSHLELGGPDRFSLGVAVPDAGWVRHAPGQLRARDQLDGIEERVRGVRAGALYSTWKEGTLGYSREWTDQEILPLSPGGDLEFDASELRCGALRLRWHRDEMVCRYPRLDLHDAQTGGLVLRVEPGVVISAAGMVLAIFDGYRGADGRSAASTGFVLHYQGKEKVVYHTGSRRFGGAWGAGSLRLQGAGVQLVSAEAWHPLRQLMLVAVQQFLARPGRGVAASFHYDTYVGDRAGLGSRDWGGRVILVVVSLAYLVSGLDELWTRGFSAWFQETCCGALPLLILIILWGWGRRRARVDRVFPTDQVQAELRADCLISANHVPWLYGDIGHMEPDGFGLGLSVGPVHRSSRLGARRMFVADLVLENTLDARAASSLDAPFSWERDGVVHLCGPQRWLELLPDQRSLQEARTEISRQGRPGFSSGSRHYAFEIHAGRGLAITITDPCSAGTVFVLGHDLVQLDNGCRLGRLAARSGPGTHVLSFYDGSRLELDLAAGQLRGVGLPLEVARVDSGGSGLGLCFDPAVPELMAALALSMVLVARGAGSR